MMANIEMTRKCVDFATSLDSVRQMVFLSTSEIYGPQAEDAEEGWPAIVFPDSLRWSYAASKLVGELLILEAAIEYKMSTVRVRPFNVYGRWRLGENAVTNMVRAAVRGEPIYINGNGTQIRGWCHVSDIVRGLVACLDYVGGDDSVFNIGDDKSVLSVTQLAQLIVEIADSNSQLVYVDTEVPDVKTRVPNLTNARTAIKYQPTVDLRDGLTEVIEWARQTFV